MQIDSTQASDATEQLSVVERMTLLVEKAREILDEEAILDSLEGPEGQNLSELQSRLDDARACLRALRKQLKARGAVRS